MAVEAVKGWSLVETIGFSLPNVGSMPKEVIEMMRKTGKGDSHVSGPVVDLSEDKKSKKVKKDSKKDK